MIRVNFHKNLKKKNLKLVIGIKKTKKIENGIIRRINTVTDTTVFIFLVILYNHKESFLSTKHPIEIRLTAKNFKIKTILKIFLM